MKFDTITTTIVWLAALILSFDTAATVTAKKNSKNSKNSKSQKQNKKCSQVLYFSNQDNFDNAQLYSVGPPALKNQLCVPSGNPTFENCSGDRAVVSPTSVYQDENLTKRVGFFTRVATYVSATRQTVFTGAIVFDEGSNAGSEIASTGFGPYLDVFSEDGLGFAITGGVGHFIGVSGDIAQRQSRTGATGSFTINCLESQYYF